MPRRKDLPPRPPTPYPFRSDPAWGAIKRSRGGRHPLSVKQRKASVCAAERIIYRHVAPHEIRKVSVGQGRRDAAPSPLATPDSIVEHRHARPRTGLAEPYRSAIDITNHRDVQRQIHAQNERIARRPLSTSSPGRAGQKRVHFELPRNAEIRHPGADLVGRFERLQVGEPWFARCNLCGQRLSCRGCRNFVSRDMS